MSVRLSYNDHELDTFCFEQVENADQCAGPWCEATIPADFPGPLCMTCAGSGTAGTEVLPCAPGERHV